MNEKKKPGCLWRLAKFTFLTIILMAAAGYFLCWRTPEFQLTPERTGWTIQDVPRTEDGKFTDHGKAFELAYPEIFANPHKNGWRRVLMAAGDGVFYDDWVEDLRNARLVEEFWPLNAGNWEKFVTRHRESPGVFHDDEFDTFAPRWHAMWAFYLARMDISAESVSGDAPMGYVPPDGALRKEARAALVAYAHDYAEKYPHVAADPRDIFEDDEHRPLGASEHDAPGADYAGLRVPYDVRMAYEGQVMERLKSRAWRAAEHPELAAWVESQSAFLDTVAEAARAEVYCPIFARETAEYPLGAWAYPIGACLHERIGHGLSVRCAMRLGAGDVSGAAADLETLQRLAGHLYRSPVYHHHTWADGMTQAAARLMGSVIAAGEYTEAQRDAFRAWLETPRPRVRVRDLLSYDKMIYLDAAQRGAKLQAWFVRDFPGLPFNPNRATQELAQAYRWAEELNSVKKMAEETADFQPLYDLTVREALATQLFTRARTDYLVACVKRKAIQLAESSQEGGMAEAHRDLARVALAVAEYRAKHGDFPETLAALVPEYLAEVPADVFLPGGKVKYRVEPGRAVIYSAGFDGEDNGGVTDYYEDGFIPENAENVAVPESDLVLRIEN